MERKSYGQFCALARALDRVGDRWTLLIVRELLLGPRTFRDLTRTLPGVGPSLLSKRLSGLVHDGIIQRNDAPTRSKTVEYALTPAGQALEGAVLELIRWGARWMTSGPGDDAVEPEWALLAIRALLDGAPAQGTDVVHLDVEGHWLTVSAADGVRRVRSGRVGDPDAVVTTELPTALAVASGVRPLAGAGAIVSGSTRRAAKLLISPVPIGR